MINVKIKDKNMILTCHFYMKETFFILTLFNIN